MIRLLFVIPILVFIACNKKSYVNTTRQLLVRDLESLDTHLKSRFLDGYKEVGDAGSGHISLTKKENLSIDNGVVFASSKKGFVWQRRMQDTIKLSFYNIDNSGDTEVTNIVQAAIETAHVLDVGVIHFQDGKYLIDQLDFHPGVEFLGSKHTILFKMPSDDRFKRLFTSKKNQYFSDSPSNWLKFTNLKFDGQSELCGLYNKFELEHQQLIFLAAQQDSKGRLRVEINNCHFQNGTSDGIHVYHNVDARIYNCTAENVFRGGIVIGGGNSKIVVNNFASWGNRHKTGIDVEVDGKGYKQSYRVDIKMTNLKLAGDCDIAVRDGYFYGKNIKCTESPYNFAARNGTIFIEDSEFHSSSEEPGKFVIPSSVSFSKCKFIHHSNGKDIDVANIIQWNSQNFKGKNERVIFDKCTFNRNGDKVQKSIAIKGLTDVSNRENLLVLKNCSISDEFNTGISFEYGGNLSLESSNIDSDLPIYLGSNNTNGNFNYKATIKDLRTRNDVNVKINYKEHKNNVIILKGESIDKSEIRSIKGISKSKIIRNN